MHGGPAGRRRYLAGRTLISATGVVAAGGPSGCQRPEEVTCAAGLIEVKAVRVYDQPIEGRPHAVVELAAVVPHVPRTGRLLRLLGLHNLSAKDCVGTGVAVLRPGREGLARHRHTASGPRQTGHHAGARILLTARRRFPGAGRTHPRFRRTGTVSSDLVHECADGACSRAIDIHVTRKNPAKGANHSNRSVCLDRGTE